MSRLTELRAENDKILDRTKEMLEQFPGKSWGQNQQNEWDRLMNRTSQIESEMAGLNAHAQQSISSGWKNEAGGDVTMLRSAKDIRSHYSRVAAAAGSGNEPIAIDEFLRGVAGMKSSRAVQNALSVGTDTAGGFMIPSVVMPNILEALVPASSLLTAGAAIIPLDNGAKSFTTAAVDTIPTAAWRLEAGNVSESDATFRAVVAQPRSLAFMFKVSRELLADAPNMSAALTTAIAQAFAKELDRVGLRGSGVAPQPLGILGTAGIQSVSNGANGTVLGSYGNFLSAAQSILQADAPMPMTAIMSPRSLIKLAALADTTGQPIEKPSMLENWQMIATSQIPNNLTVGTSTDCSEIYVGDFSKIHFMMREMMSIQLVNEMYSGTGQIGFVCHVRADVSVMYPKAFAVVTGVR